MVKRQYVRLVAYQVVRGSLAAVVVARIYIQIYIQQRGAAHHRQPQKGAERACGRTTVKSRLHFFPASANASQPKVAMKFNSNLGTCTDSPHTGGPSSSVAGCGVHGAGRRRRARRRFRPTPYVLEVAAERAARFEA